jgi:hypothetical protein
MSLTEGFTTGVYSEAAYWIAKLVYSDTDYVRFSFIVDDGTQDVVYTTPYKNFKLRGTTLAGSEFGSIRPSVAIDGEVILKYRERRVLSFYSSNKHYARHIIKEDFMRMASWLVDTMKSKNMACDLSNKIKLFFMGERKLRQLPLRFSIIRSIDSNLVEETFITNVDEIRLIANVIGECADAYDNDKIALAVGAPNDPLEQMKETMIQMKYAEILDEYRKDHSYDVVNKLREFFHENCKEMKDWQIIKELRNIHMNFL